MQLIMAKNAVLPNDITLLQQVKLACLSLRVFNFDFNGAFYNEIYFVAFLPRFNNLLSSLKGFFLHMVLNLIIEHLIIFFNSIM